MIKSKQKVGFTYYNDNYISEGNTVNNYQHLLDIPISVNYKISLKKDNKLILKAGAYGGVLLGNTNSGTVAKNDKMTFNDRWNYGLSLGVKYEFNKRWYITANYNFGLRDFDSSDQYSSRIKQISIGVGYKF